MTESNELPFAVPAMFHLKEQERESHPLRLPAGTKDRIQDISARLQAIDPRLTFELQEVIAAFVDRTLDRAAKEVTKMEAQIKAQHDEAEDEDDEAETGDDAQASVNDKPGVSDSGSTSTTGSGGAGAKSTLAGGGGGGGTGTGT